MIKQKINWALGVTIEERFQKLNADDCVTKDVVS